jgi:hypothetical protein
LGIEAGCTHLRTLSGPGGGTYVWQCPSTTVSLLLAPGLLNLLPAAWLFSRERRIRLAAGLAIILGILRVAVPWANHTAAALSPDVGNAVMVSLTNIFVLAEFPNFWVSTFFLSMALYVVTLIGVGAILKLPLRTQTTVG